MWRGISGARQRWPLAYLRPRPISRLQSIFGSSWPASEDSGYWPNGTSSVRGGDDLWRVAAPPSRASQQRQRSPKSRGKKNWFHADVCSSALVALGIGPVGVD